jgi:hypothetical protein
MRVESKLDALNFAEACAAGTAPSGVSATCTARALL